VSNWPHDSPERMPSSGNTVEKARRPSVSESENIPCRTHARIIQL
jgi:hypothetical protein